MKPLLAALLLVLVAGCGGSSGDHKRPDSAESSLRAACNALNDPQTKGMPLVKFGDRQRAAVKGTPLQRYFDQLAKFGDGEDLTDEGIRAYTLASRAIWTNVRSECATVHIQIVPQPGEDGFVLNE